MLQYSHNLFSVLVLAAVLSLVAGANDARAEGGDIVVRQPGAGEVFTAGETMRITWLSADAEGTVTIDMWNGDAAEYIPIGANIPIANGAFKWIIPSNLYGSQFRLRISSDANPSVLALSFSFFSIKQNNTPGPGPGLLVDSGSVRIAPNPAGEQIVVSWDEDVKPVSITLIDLLGTRIKTQRVDGGATAGFRIGSLTAGTYIVEAQRLDGTVERGKFIKH